MSAKLTQVRRVLWITLGLNLLVAGAKLAYGLATGMLSMAADGIHSFLDGGNNVVGLIAVSAAEHPPDDLHPYGHRKFETFAALAVGGMLLLACWEIVKGAVDRLSTGGTNDAGPAGFAIMLGTLAVNLFVSWYEDREGRRWSSEILRADAVHTRSDVLTSLAVMAALGASLLGWPWMDAVTTFVIVAWIGVQAWRVTRPAVGILADESRLESARVAEVALAVPGVRDAHRIRTRGHADHVFVDLHVQVAPTVTVGDAHGIAHEVERAIRAGFPEVVDVLTHLEPHGDPVEGLDGRVEEEVP